MPYIDSQSFQGIGAQLSIGGVVGTAGALLPVFEITDQAFPEGTWDKLNVSNFNSLNKAKEYRKGMVDFGEMKLKGNFVPADPGQLALAAAFADPQNPYQFTMQYPKAPGQATAGNLYAFNAVVMGFSPGSTLQPDKTVELSVTLQIVSAPVLTAGS
ncbi:hypothetical protein GOB94_14070 [Granulicella sp. 5B5]|uniref:phage tail tube protein n=1 Tax=Granulicella sp. 5B5 TaxID=1617967 RepID=UPI0015F7510D|nr:phage tail tube protein [Granulicella sp. 5B5]QMV19692.1 hypothetical protein GOB94_14070 [Granulicella sp. 5B5]